MDPEKHKYKPESLHHKIRVYMFLLTTLMLYLASCSDSPIISQATTPDALPLPTNTPGVTLEPPPIAPLATLTNSGIPDSVATLPPSIPDPLSELLEGEKSDYEQFSGSDIHTITLGDSGTHLHIIDTTDQNQITHINTQAIQDLFAPNGQSPLPFTIVFTNQFSPITQEQEQLINSLQSNRIQVFLPFTEIPDTLSYSLSGNTPICDQLSPFVGPAMGECPDIPLFIIDPILANPKQS